MSVLSFPRLYLRGTMSWDPIVSNNHPANYDAITAHAKLRPGETVVNFRKRMIATTTLRRDWNYFGTHVCAMEQARVTGGAAGPDDRDVRDDILLDARAELVGKLVDIDPLGVFSQIFFDEFSLGLPGHPHLRARPRRRMSSRWLNLSRNPTLGGPAGAGAAWQAVFPTADVEIVRSEASPLLVRFEEALRDRRAQGLMLRLSTYRTQYYQNGIRNRLERAASMAELQQLHEQGKPVSNPAYSRMVGVLGVWLDGDSEAVPGGRHLFGTALVPNGGEAVAGPAAAEFHPDAKLLSLDFSNTIPERTSNATKVDLGPITVQVMTTAGPKKAAEIKPSAYDRAAYEAHSGIVDIDLSASPDSVPLPSEGALRLTLGESPESQILLAEQELTTFCDDCNVYVDEGETRTLTIRVRERGEVPRRSVSILAAWYVQQGLDLVFTGESTVLAVLADGTANLEVGFEVAGVRHLRFLAFAGDAAPVPDQVLSILTAQLTSVRTLPSHDPLEAATPDEALTWEFIYENVLLTYDAIAPRMSNIIDLADVDAVRTFARRIKEVTDVELFESPRYMPVTRDLSRGKRRLLQRFCDLAITTPSPQEEPAGAPPRDDFATTAGVLEPVDVPFDKRLPP